MIALNWIAVGMGLVAIQWIVCDAVTARYNLYRKREVYEWQGIVVSLNKRIYTMLRK